MTNVLIVGANGFIGKHLSSLLSEIDSIKLTLFSTNISDELIHITNNSCEYIEGDFSNTTELVELLKNQDIVYHLVSTSFPANSWQYPVVDITDNLIPSVNLFSACADAKVKKVVFASSGGAVYGKQQKILNESDLLKPFSPYGIIKASIEYFLEYFRLKSNLNYDIYRISNAYGPYLDKPGFGVINTWLKAVSNNSELTLMGDGTAEKDYIYVDDVSQVIAKSVIHNLNKSEVYNLCSGRTSSLNEILQLIQFVTQKSYKLRTISGPSSDNTKVLLDNAKVNKIFNIDKVTSLEEGIRSTWAYYKK